MLYISLLVMLVFALLGILFSKGKGGWLIAGYNMASPSEKAKYDETALCKFMAKAMFAYIPCWGIVALQSVFGSMVFFWVGFGLFLGVTVFVVTYMNTGNHFQK